MTKHTIYALVDPRNDTPFYVGATRYDLKNRLHWHLNFVPAGKRGKSVADGKVKLIKDLLKENKMPLIEVLANTTIEKVDFLEKFYYEKLTSEGFVLYQHSSFFNSSGTKERHDGTYRISLKLDPSLEEPLKELAKRNGRTINDEIVIAVERHIRIQKSKLK
jgi:hypothetical protein